MPDKNEKRLSIESRFFMPKQIAVQIRSHPRFLHFNKV